MIHAKCIILGFFVFAGKNTVFRNSTALGGVKWEGNITALSV